MTQTQNLHRGFGGKSNAIWAGAALLAAAGLVLAAERKGYFRRMVVRRPELGQDPQGTVKDRLRRNRKQRDTDPLAPLGGEA